MLCCKHMKDAFQDKTIFESTWLGWCLVASRDAKDEPQEGVPIDYCPWCGKSTPRVLAKAPPMIHRS